MGIFLEEIQYCQETEREFVHRIPDAGSAEIAIDARLIVQESQAAILFGEGKAQMAFQSGRHSLNSQTIPLPAHLLLTSSSGETVFLARVYFVSLKSFPYLKWGTEQPIKFRDVKLGLVPLRSYGTYSIRIADPQRFAAELGEARGIGETAAIERHFRAVIVQNLTDLLSENLAELLELGNRYNELAATLKDRIQREFRRYGIELTDFYVSAITPPEEVQQQLSKYAGQGAMHHADMGRLSQLRPDQALSQAAESGAGMGAGMGAGLQMMMPTMLSKSLLEGQPPAPPQIAPQARTQTATCLGCGATQPPEAKFCSNCGIQMGKRPITCPACSRGVPSGSKFCSHCGKRLFAPGKTCPRCGQEIPTGAESCVVCGEESS